MSAWECAIRGCGRSFDDLEVVLAHQVRDHRHHECRVCGASLPRGFFAIRHAVREHSRAEYARHYEADSADIRVRESLVADIEDAVDVDGLRERLGDEDVPSAVSAD